MLKNFISFLCVTMLLFLSACSGITTVKNAQIHTPLDSKLTTIRVLYQVNNLSSTTPNAKTGTKDIAYTGYDDLPKILSERVPLVFELNHISAIYEQTNNAFFTLQTGSKNKAWNESKAPILDFQAMNGHESFNNYGGSVVINMPIRLHDALDKNTYWDGSLENIVYYGGFGLSGHIDAKYVDNMLKVLLQQMAKDNIIYLPNNVAKLPL